MTKYLHFSGGKPANTETANAVAQRSVKPVGRTSTVDDITLCAINTGALYLKHVELVRAKASDEKWLVHTLLHVLPSYRKDTRTIEHFDAETVKTVAVNLKDYYMQHRLAIKYRTTRI